ncbi:hypothetical protein BH10ACT1_BH10ACT1_06500 [soil metagenome]
METGRRMPQDGDGRQPGPAWLVAVGGTVTVTDPAGARHPVRGQQPQLVLARLALEGGPVLRDDLAELLWGDGPLPDHWAGAVRGVLSKVRGALQAAGAPATVVRADGGLVSLDLPGGWTTDLDRAGELVAEAQSAREAGDLSAALARLVEARSLLAAPLFTTADGDWVRRLRERVSTVEAEAVRSEVETLLDLGRAGDAADVAAARVAFEPLDEVAHDLLVRAHLLAGRRVAAQRAFDHLRDVLARELGIAPAAATAERLRKAEEAPVEPDALAGGRAAVDGDRADQRFVGRSAELEVLHRAWAEVVASGRPGVALVEGQTGIGKTRLAEELTLQLAGEAVGVLWGRCRATTGLAYEPVADALRRRVAADGPALVERLGGASVGLAHLVPELGLAEARVTDDPDVARTVLFRDVADTVAALVDRPTVWVVDDLQWASDDTLALLEVVLDGLDRPLLLVVTVRNSPASVSDGLARLQRVVPVTAVELGGLTEAEVLPLLADLPGARGDHAARLDLARALHRRTGGHPFFLTEIARDARRQGTVDVDETPEAARQWVRRRADSLPPTLARRLDLAAVIGLDVDLAVVERATSETADAVLDRFEELVALGFLAEPEEPGTFVFPHQITRDVIYERLGGTRRARLHQSVAEAIEAGPDRPGRAAELAHHHARSGPDGERRAVTWATVAGRESLAGSAWALAVEQLTRAEALVRDEVQRAVLLVPLGIARHRLRQPEAAEAALDEAVVLARRHRLAVVLADAALHLVGRGGRGAAQGMPDVEQAGLLREALDALAQWPRGAGDEDPRQRELLQVALEGELALALFFDPDPAERWSLVLDALERVRARPDPDPVLLAKALLNARLAKVEPDRFPERLADLAEIVALPAGLLTPEVVIAARTYGHEDRFRLGDRAGAAAELAAAREQADRFGHPFWQWAVATWESLHLVVDGHLDEAEERLLASLSLQGGSPPEAVACLGVQLVDIRLFQGRAGEVVDLLAATAAANPLIPAYAAVESLCRAESGDLAGAEAAYLPFVERAFVLPQDTNRFLALAVLGDVCADLGDADGARTLTGLLEPYAEQHVLLNCYGGGGAYWGPTSRILARLALLDGRPDDARRLFADAARRAADFGAPLALLRVERDAAVLIG